MASKILTTRYILFVSMFSNFSCKSYFTASCHNLRPSCSHNGVLSNCQGRIRKLYKYLIEV